MQRRSTTESEESFPALSLARSNNQSEGFQKWKLKKRIGLGKNFLRWLALIHLSLPSLTQERHLMVEPYHTAKMKIVSKSNFIKNLLYVDAYVYFYIL